MKHRLNSRLRLALPLVLLASVPLLGGAKGDGCAANSRSPAPDVTGTWDMSYDDALGVEIKLGGSVYTAEVGAQGGTVTINHEGNPITFDLDCDNPAILCPSEAWPAAKTCAMATSPCATQNVLVLLVSLATRFASTSAAVS